MPLDLHINPNMSGVLHAEGAILYYSDESDSDPHCYVESILNGNMLNF